MKIVTIPDIGDVQLQKHAKSQSIRISIKGDGKIVVTMPKWAPYSAGIAFVRAKHSWIVDNKQPETSIQNGQAIGKFHHIYFRPSPDTTAPTTRQKGSELWVTYSENLSTTNPDVQKSAQAIAKRLADLASKHDFTYNSVSVRQLKARWGSCSSKSDITLNFFLMQLPWDLIDYVLLHELTHTKAMHHGPEFWEIFDSVLPGAKKKRAQLRAYKPAI
jgi:predicted metal-dependent hydrolase